MIASLLTWMGDGAGVYESGMPFKCENCGNPVFNYEVSTRLNGEATECAYADTNAGVMLVYEHTIGRLLSFHFRAVTGIVQIEVECRECGFVHVRETAPQNSDAAPAMQ